MADLTTPAGIEAKPGDKAGYDRHARRFQGDASRGGAAPQARRVNRKKLQKLQVHGRARLY